jgi:AcrR family transcriptional regulator
VVRTKRPAPRRPDSERLQTRIRAAATRLIAQHGFDAVAVNDIATAVGISKQALLYHFPSKDALREAVLAHLMEHANRHLLALMATLTGDEASRLERAVEQIRIFFDAEPHAARVILRELLDGEGREIGLIRKGAEPWFRFVVDGLQRGQRDGIIRPELDPEATVVHIGTLVLATFALLPLRGWTQASAAEWRERRLRETVRIIERYLFVRAAPPPAP